MTADTPTDHARALEVLGKITPGRWLAANMVHAERGDRMTPEELGEYVANSVKRSRAEGGTDDFLFITTPGDDVPDICHVGNGPTGPHNARAIAVTPQFVALFAAAARRKTILDKMFARAMRKNADVADEDTAELSKELDASEDDLDAALAAVTKGVLGHE